MLMQKYLKLVKQALQLACTLTGSSDAGDIFCEEAGVDRLDTGC